MLERRPNGQSDSPRLAEKHVAQVLLPEFIAQSDGVGPEIDVGADCGNLLVLTLSINHVSEREGLVVSIRGSADGCDWGLTPLLTWPEKYYCGLYSVLLNLAIHPQVRYLRVEWKIKRWAKGDCIPKFGFSVFMERSGSRVSTAVA
jgi:hypothetical protein